MRRAAPIRGEWTINSEDGIRSASFGSSYNDEALNNNENR